MTIEPVVYGLPACLYLALKVYEEVLLDGHHLLPAYGDVVFKLLPMVSLLLWNLISDDVDERYRMLLGFAMVFSMGGDALLELHHFKHHFLFGLGSFLIAHLFYIAAFLGRPKITITRVLGGVLAAGSVYYLGDLYYVSAPSALALPVACYCTVIGAMVIAAIFCGHIKFPGTAITDHVVCHVAILFFFVFPGGAVIFAMSDAVIGAERFVWGGNVAGARVFIMFTYYLAQFLLAASFEVDDETYFKSR